MKKEDIITIIQNQYSISINNFKVIPRLMFRESFYFDDDNGRKYVIKKYPKSTEDQELVSIIRFYSELCHYGTITNKIVFDRDKNAVFELADGKYVIFTYLEGEKCNIANFKLSYGSALKSLHNSLCTMDTNLAGLSTQEQVNQCIANINDWEEIDELSSMIIGMTAETLKACKNYQTSTLSIIHGDCTRNNCIITDNKITFIDFDNFKTGDPLEDLANAANSVLYDDEIPLTSDKENTIIHIFSDYGLQRNEFERVKNYMKINCVIELYKHRENYRYLRRTPGTKNYLGKLIGIFNSVNYSLLQL
ncbi:phosphotransferase [Lacrimispora sp. AGF001]|uniref:phosphotransferase n=1 Tax=Lacrimispora sp. AGF001 TaxID=3401631 RepID=UPI003B430E25